MSYQLIHGDCLTVLRGMEPDSVDAIVTDPPYMIDFMGKAFDTSKNNIAGRVEVWAAALRVAKPGAHLLAFGGTRTHHRLMVAIEDAGWEIRDCLMWLYGSGFPKSHDISKAIDRMRDDNKPAREVGAWLRSQRENAGFTQKQIAAHWPSATGGLTGCVANWELGFNVPKWDQWLDLKWLIGFGDEMDAEVWRLNGRKGKPGDAWYEREVVGQVTKGSSPLPGNHNGTWADGQRDGTFDITAPATDAAKQWDGWGTALKPAYEIIINAIKPFPDQTECNLIVGNLSQKEAQLWLLLHVSTVGHSSTLSQDELNEVLSIAQWSAEKLTSIQADLCGQMGTSQFASMVNTCLNIVASWKSTLADLWKPENTSTTSTASSPTIDLKTLSYLVSQTTLENIIQAEMQAPGSRLNVLPVGAYLSAVEANISSTRMLSALENATYGERTKRLDGADDLTPAWEPVILARKPLSEPTIAANVLRWGTGGLNVDGCRIGTSKDVPASPRNGTDRIYGTYGAQDESMSGFNANIGRWPANLALDEDAAALLDAQSGEQKSGDPRKSDGTRSQRVGNDGWDRPWKHGEQRQENFPGYGDSGGASRFFYCAKASKRDRDEGLEGMPLKDASVGDRRPSGSMSQRIHADEGRPDTKARNHHPTVKSTPLMRWLVRLVTPPGGTVLDPFMGSGSTLKAAMLEGFNGVGIDIDEEYLAIADKRIAHAIAQYVQQQEMAALQPRLLEETP